MICHDLHTALQDPDAVRELNLSRLGLKKLPDEVRKLRGLRVLDVRWNQLETLPDWIGELSELEVLYAQHNRLSVWPIAGAQLGKLRRLELGGNQLKKMPVMGLPPDLEGLGLSENRIRSLRWDRPFPGLKRLELQRNRLATWPVWGDMPGLQHLDLSRNTLKELPASPSLPMLTYLDLARNRLQEVGPLGKLRALQYLNLSRNRLEILAPELGRLPFLRKLNLSHNQLSQLPASFSGLKWLREIALHHNRCEQIPGVLVRMPHLEWIDLERNQLSGNLDLPGPASLRSLNLGHNRIRQVYQLPPNLGSLNLRYNPLIRFKGLDKYPKLRRLDCTKTQLETWPEALFARSEPLFLTGVQTAKNNELLRAVLEKMPLSVWAPIQRHAVFATLRDRRPGVLELWDSHDLVRLLPINSRRLRDMVRGILLARSNPPLAKAGALALYGRLQTPTEELTRQLERCRLQLDPKAEVVVLGRPPYPPPRRSYRGCSFFSEAAVLDYLRSLEMPVGASLSPAQEEKLIKLLLHPYAAQVKLGLNLLASQTLGPRLEAALVLAFKLQQDQAIKTKLRQLIDRRCSPELWPLVSRPLLLWRGMSLAERQGALRKWLQGEKAESVLFLDLLPFL